MHVLAPAPAAECPFTRTYCHFQRPMQFASLVDIVRQLSSAIGSIAQTRCKILTNTPYIWAYNTASYPPPEARRTICLRSGHFFLLALSLSPQGRNGNILALCYMWPSQFVCVAQFIKDPLNYDFGSCIGLWKCKVEIILEKSSFLLCVAGHTIWKERSSCVKSVAILNIYLFIIS